MWVQGIFTVAHVQEQATFSICFVAEWQKTKEMKKPNLAGNLAHGLHVSNKPCSNVQGSILTDHTCDM